MGTTAKTENSVEICRNCGKIKHDGDCSQPAHCENSEGHHPYSCRDCPKWKVKREIQRVRIRDKCSFGEAKAKVLETIPTPTERSFASVTASALTSIPAFPSHFETLEKALALLT